MYKTGFRNIQNILKKNYWYRRCVAGVVVQQPQYIFFKDVTHLISIFSFLLSPVNLTEHTAQSDLTIL